MKSILLIGLGDFGRLIAKQICEMGHQVMAVDKEEEKVNAVLPFVTDALIGDSTNEAFLKSLGVANYDVCIVTICKDFQSSLETTSLLKELGASLVVSRASREVQAKFLLRNGADQVVNPEQEFANWMSLRYTADHILDYIKVDNDYGMFEVRVPREWQGKSIREIDIRKLHGINIMAIKENGKNNFCVQPDIVLNGQETLLVLGENKAVQKCFRM